MFTSSAPPSPAPSENQETDHEGLTHIPPTPTPTSARAGAPGGQRWQLVQIRATEHKQGGGKGHRVCREPLPRRGGALRGKSRCLPGRPAPLSCTILTTGKGAEILPNVPQELLAVTSPFLNLAKDRPLHARVSWRAVGTINRAPQASLLTRLFLLHHLPGSAAARWPQPCNHAPRSPVAGPHPAGGPADPGPGLHPKPDPSPTSVQGPAAAKLPR